MGTTVNFHQIVEMTYEEKKAMYMKEKKEKLVEMLIECNRIIDAMPITAYEYKDYDINDYLFGITG